MNSYWQKAQRRGISRRRAITAAATLVGGGLAASVIGCGGGNDAGNVAPKDSSGLLTKPVDTKKNAVKGGIMPRAVGSDPPNFDPVGNGGNVTTRTSSDGAYPVIIGYKPGTFEDPADGSFWGEAVSSWEWSPDNLAVTMKVRQPQKLDPRPPTNSRQLNSQDLRWSLERYSKLNAGRAVLLNSVHPDGPLDSVQYPDNSTLVMKLAFPSSSLFGILAGGTISPYVMPIEAEDKFDPKNEMRGSRAFMLTAFEPSVRREYRRNPNFWETSRPYMDGLDDLVIPDSATVLAQFQAKRLWEYTNPTNDQVLTLKRQIPEVDLFARRPFGGDAPPGMGYFSFSALPNSPFGDERVRYAFSMLIDRDTALEAMFNISALSKEGIPMESAWHGTAPCDWRGVWLDPKKNELGEASKFFYHNPEEATKLLRAAGRFGLETRWTTYRTSYRGETQRRADIMLEMLQAGGHFKIRVNNTDLDSDFLPNFYFAKGQFEGISHASSVSLADFGLFMQNSWVPSGRLAVIKDPLPKVHDLFLKHQAEFDPKKRLALELEWQKEMAILMPTVPNVPGKATTFRMAWPWLGNAAITSLWGNPRLEPYIYDMWYDRSKDMRGT